MDTTKATGSFIPALIALIAGWTMPVNMACALPQNGAVTSGGSTIARPDANTMHINQATDKAIINWQGYSIGANETVKYFQPGSGSISLNRVTGADPSLIYGQLSANGQVWVINPNGMLIGQNAKINVGGFLGSTLNITDKDFLSGNYNFKATDSPLSAIGNDGNIQATDGGYVVFVSPNISNSGNITANRGSVNMASGDDVILTFANNGLINLVINKETAKGTLGIDNSGAIMADGGQVVLSAKVASDALKTVINNTGIIQARTIENHNGVIKLLGSMENNAVKIGGTLDASAPNGGDGGFIETSAHEVILDNPSVGARAPFGKAGEWLIDPTDLTISDATAYNASLDAGTNVTVATSGAGAQAGNITVAMHITKSAGADATLTLQAHNNIIVNSGVSISSTSNKLNVIFDADSDASGAGNIQMKSVSSILSNGGNITLGGGANPAVTAAMGSGTNMLVNDIYGIVLSSATLNAGAGNISLRGTGSAGVSNARGIYAYSGTSIQTTTGAIALNGTGGGNSYNNYGVDLQNSTTKILSASGPITVTGTGGGNGSNTGNYGIYLHDGAAIKSTGTATVTLNGTGGSGTDLNYGVFLQDLSNTGTTVSTVDGAISITGHGGGSGAGNDGIRISSWTPPSGVSVKATGAGGITLNGTGAGGTNSNYGAYIENATISSASGLISITGTGGAGSGISNYGVFIDPSNITSASGNISVSASGGNGENGILTQTSGANNLISGQNVTISANAPAGTTISLPGTTVTSTGTTTITNTTAAAPAPTPAPAPASTTSGGGSGSGSSGSSSSSGAKTTYPSNLYGKQADEIAAQASRNKNYEATFRSWTSPFQDPLYLNGIWENPSNPASVSFSKEKGEQALADAKYRAEHALKPGEQHGSREGMPSSDFTGENAWVPGGGDLANDLAYALLSVGSNFSATAQHEKDDYKGSKEEREHNEWLQKERESHSFDAKPAEYKEPEGADIFKYFTPEEVLANTKAAIKQYMDVDRWNGAPRSVLDKLNVKFNMARERVKQNEAIRNANARLQYYRRAGFQNAENLSGAKAGDWLK